MKWPFVIVLFLSLFSQAQSVTGYWYGTAEVAYSSSKNNYMMELIVNQKGNAVNGVLNYYFRDTYRSIKVNGIYNPKSREVLLFDLRLPYAGSGRQMEVDCPMDLKALLQVARAGSDLKGKFASRNGYKYTCPDLVFSFKRAEGESLDSLLTAIKNFKETYQLWRPSGTDTLVTAVVQQRKIENPVINREYTERQVEVEKVLEVASDSLQLDFYDNGEIDGDSISIFFNKQLLGANLRLSNRAIHLNIKLDTTKEYNELTMFANNLGTIPPNTAILILYDGVKRHETSLVSSLTKNGTIRIYRKPASSGPPKK